MHLACVRFEFETSVVYFILACESVWIRFCVLAYVKVSERILSFILFSEFLNVATAERKLKYNVV